MRIEIVSIVIVLAGAVESRAQENPNPERTGRDHPSAIVVVETGKTERELRLYRPGAATTSFLVDEKFRGTGSIAVSKDERFIVEVFYGKQTGCNVFLHEDGEFSKVGIYPKLKANAAAVWGGENPQMLSATGWDMLLHLQLLPSCQEVGVFLAQDPGGTVVTLDFSPDGRYFSYGCNHRGIGGYMVMNRTTGKPLWTGNHPGLHHVRIRPGFPHILTAGTEGKKSVQLLDLSSGTVIHNWVQSDVWDYHRQQWSGAAAWTKMKDSLCLTADGRRLYIVRTDGTVQALDIDEDGHISEVAKLTSMRGGEWQLVLAGGSYAASPGAMDGLKEELHRPSRVKQALIRGK